MTEKTFASDYYDKDYFVTPGGKKCITESGELKQWSYSNPTGDWEFAQNICKAWKEVFKPIKMLDVGAGRGTFVGYAIEQDINAVGFDFSDFAVTEGRFYKCPQQSLVQQDVTKPWPYKDGEFDFIICLDLMEHIYEDNIDFVISEMYRVSSKYCFLQICSSDKVKYSLKKGDVVPKEFEVYTLTGHVLIQNHDFWLERFFNNYDWKNNKELLEKFYATVFPPFDKESAWMKNLMLVLEKKES